MGYTKESQISTVATLPHFLTPPSHIPASSDIALSLFSLYPDDFLMPLKIAPVLKVQPSIIFPKWNFGAHFLPLSLYFYLSSIKLFPRSLSPMAYGHSYLEVQPLMQYVQNLIYHLLSKAATLFSFFLLLIYTYIF